MSVCLETKDLTKRFPGVLANDHIDLKVQRGELHALLGENGAGKSTFMNIVSGLYRADSGEIYIDGQKTSIKSPHDAIKLGIFMVHQNFSLIRPFTITENVGLIPQLSSGFMVEAADINRRILDLSNITGLEVNPDESVEQLPLGIQQRVEILKALAAESHLLMFDEPTSVLAPQEVDHLLKVIRSMISKGLTVIMSTHKLSEALRFTDRITVLRQGKVIATEETELLDTEKLVEYMIGRRIALDIDKSPPKMGEALLEVNGITVQGDRRTIAVKDVSFSLRSGEILGIAGVAGNGQKEMEEALTGRRHIVTGKVCINKVDVTNKDPREILKQNVGIIPEDSHVAGLNLNFTLAENCVLNSYNERPFHNRLFLNRKEIEDHCCKLMSEFDIRPPNAKLKATFLSGGNMQKLILARELGKSPKLVIASNPTRGLDVKMTAFVHQKMLEIRDNGGAILFFSDDLGEILSLSETVSVMFRGRIVGTLPASGADAMEVGRLMVGEETRPSVAS